MPPAWETYIRNLDSSQLATVTGTCEELSQEFSVLFLNLLKDDRFVENDYYDADHLSIYGAKKLAHLLSEYLL
jgi:hypothetical protein